MVMSSHPETRNPREDKMRNIEEADEKAMSMRLRILKERHQALDDEIDEANEKNYLTAREQMRIKELKVRRLRLRDLIDIMEREGVSS